MPTYSYKCTECGNAFDIQQAFADASLTTCPVCGGRLRKVFGAVGVSFNGSGFYRTDSRAGSQGSGAKAASESPASESGTSRPQKETTAAAGSAASSTPSSASSTTTSGSGASASS